MGISIADLIRGGTKLASPVFAVSVVIAGRNRPDRLVRLLESLRAQTHQPLEVIIIDDGSEPPLPPFEGTVQLRNEVSKGACQARNLAFQKASGKYVFIFDDDSELNDHTLIERAVQLADKFPNIGAIAFRQLDSQGTIHWMQPGAGIDMRLVPSFGGYGALISRQPFEAVGGFFEPLGYYYEEVELCLRMVDRGFLVLYDPSLQVLHHEDKQGRNYRAIHRLCWRNMMYTIVVRYPFVVVPAALVLSTLRWVSLSTSWRQFHVGDFTWGLGSLIRALPELISHRQPVRIQTLRRLRHWRTQVISP